MRERTNCIIIGGTGRNIGKTTLVEKLIRHLGKSIPVTAVKIANIKPGEEHFHGHNVGLLRDKIHIIRETHTDGNKDSMRFLKAGAAASWYIQTEDAFLPETFQEIEKILKEAPWIVCESNALQNFIRPALLIQVKGKETGFQAKRFHKPEQQADAVVEALNEKAFEMLIKRIQVTNGRFVLSDASE